MSDAPETYYRIGTSLFREFRADDHRIMAAYLLTCPHRTTEGLFVLPLGYLGADLGWPDKRARKAFADIASTGMVMYDDDREVCLIVEALAWQAPSNPKQITGAVRRVRAVPETGLDQRFLAAASRYASGLASQLQSQIPSRFGSVDASGDRSAVLSAVPSTDRNTHSHTQTHALSHAQLLDADAVVPHTRRQGSIT